MTAAGPAKQPAAAAAAAATAHPAAAAAAAAAGTSARAKNASAESSLQGASAAAMHRFVPVCLISSNSSSSSSHDAAVDRSIVTDPHRQCDLEATERSLEQLLARRLEGWRSRCLPALPSILQEPRLSPCSSNSSSSSCCCCCCVRLVDLNLLLFCLSPESENDLSTFFVEFMFCVSSGLLHPHAAVSFVQQQLLPRALLHLLLLLQPVVETAHERHAAAASLAAAAAAAATGSAAAFAAHSAGAAAVVTEEGNQGAPAAAATPAAAEGGDVAVKRLAEEAAFALCGTTAADTAAATATATAAAAAVDALGKVEGVCAASCGASKTETVENRPCVSFASCFTGPPSLASLDAAKARAFIDHVLEAPGQGAPHGGSLEGAPLLQQGGGAQGAPERRSLGLLPQPFLALLLDGLNVCADLNAGSVSTHARKARASVAGTPLLLLLLLLLL
ncbi:hypothetical protein Esti_005834 [Eimeria stiedai]